MLKCDFNKLQSNFMGITFWHLCSPVKLLHIFRTPFSNNISGGLPLSDTYLRFFLTYIIPLFDMLIHAASLIHLLDVIFVLLKQSIKST